MLLLVVHPNDTLLKIKTLSICSALQISIRVFQQALLGFIFGVLAAAKHCSRFFCLTSLSHPDHYIYRHTDLFFSNLSFNHTHSLLPEDCLALIWI